MVIVYVINHDGTALIIDTRQHAVTDAVDILEIPVININVHGADIVIAVAPVIKKTIYKFKNLCYDVDIKKRRNI